MNNRLKDKGAVLALAILLAPTLIHAQTQSGTLDASFGTGGKATTDFAGTVTVQADGKLVVAGGANSGFAVARYNSNGSLDTSFGASGKVTTDFGGLFQRATSVALQLDGKIVVAGGSVINEINDFAVARYNSNGSLDASFGTGGKVITDIEGVSAQAYSVAVQQDGKIVVAGAANLDGGYNFELVRYSSNGILDASFGTGGKVTTDFGLLDQGFSYAQGYSLALQQDGKILLAGQAYIGAGNDFALARYNSNGTLDIGFGTGGKVITDFGTNNDGASSMALQPDGKIVAAGLARSRFALVRYNSWGTPDTTFGTGGKVTTSIGGLNDQASQVVLQGDGKILVAGRTYVAGPNFTGNFHSALLRYTSWGTLDTSFGTAGTVTMIFGGDSDGVSSIAVQPDGKIVVSGGGTANGQNSVALARLN
jgi:uncharacterized delta-60 repeat protein